VGKFKVYMNVPITAEGFRTSPCNSILKKLYRRVIMYKLSYEAIET
jgi:hypothetical protein